jgi:uncharacterized protein (TIGR02145 family)
MKGSKVGYWSSTNYNNENAWFFNIDWDSARGRVANISKIGGWSIRCVKD